MKSAVLALLAVACAAAQADEWSDADQATRRLAPHEIKGLPAPVRADLEKRGCRIPQTFSARRVSNIARGTFVTEHEDWAVLCSIARASRILVYADGKAQRVLEVPGSLRKDADYLRLVGSGGRIGFSREIRSMGPVQAHRRQQEKLGRVVVRFQHAGIEDAFLEQVSVVHYFNGKRWMRVAGRN